MSSPGKDWMRMNLHVFGMDPLSNLVFPSSHDSGTYKRTAGTVGGSSDNVLTQNRPVLDQLCYGVRELDIRPTLAAPATNGWYCGHYTGTGIAGWQGASCASIADVVADVNRFVTGGHDELIIMRVSHTTKLKLDKDDALSATKIDDITDQEHQDLFDELKKLQYRYGAKQLGTASKPLHEFPLNKFITGGPAVLVMVDDVPAKYHNQLIADGMWPARIWEDGAGGIPRLNLTQIDGLVTHSQTDLEAVMSTATIAAPFIKLLGKNPYSVLNLADKLQNERFPRLLQMVMDEWRNGDHSKPSKIEMDRIENDDLLTFCLAITIKRKFKIMWMNALVVVYGGQNICHYKHVTDNISKHKDENRNYPVHNDNMGGDPEPGMSKSCAVIYMDKYPTAPHRYYGRWARERNDLDLS